jgi:nitroimidazol reductase NimA-like FMN-containing flavoprotein (pyridoxamine 5'-phosphate oxidase superfamily)
MSADERARVRRSDREVTDEAWIDAFLQGAAAGALALSGSDQPFINTNLFVYDAARRAIYLHTARSGRTRDTLSANPRACFSVMQMGRLLPAAVALEFSVEYAGVTVFGSACVVEDAAEAAEALQALLDKYAPHLRAGADYRPPVAEELQRTTVIRLDIESVSGKRKVVAADFPGAFTFAEPDMIHDRQAD